MQLILNEAGLERMIAALPNPWSRTGQGGGGGGGGQFKETEKQSHYYRLACGDTEVQKTIVSTPGSDDLFIETKLTNYIELNIIY